MSHTFSRVSDLTMKETTLAGTTERKKRSADKGSYLLLHRSGRVARTKTLTTSQPIDGITAIINLETLEQYDGERWEKIPDGYDTIIQAEEELIETEDDEFDDDEDELTPDAIQLGSKRCFSPNLVWAYCKLKLKVS